MATQALFTLVALVGLAGSGRAEPPAGGCPRYYVVLFGGQSERLRPRTAHTWATFVRTEPRPDGTVALESFTISWLPCRLPVRPLAPRSEPGRNYALHETLDLFETCRAKLSVWGPFEIRECWYRGAEAHKAYLDSGVVRYKLLDGAVIEPAGGTHRPELSHCVHAVTRTDEGLRRATSPVVSYGEHVTAKVVKAAADVGLFVCPDVTHDWLFPALGIDKYHYARRRIGDSVSATTP